MGKYRYIDHYCIWRPGDHKKGRLYYKIIKKPVIFIYTFMFKFFTRNILPLKQNIRILVYLKPNFENRSFCKRSYIKEGGRRVFVGAMKYFRHILMGHEIFFKIFDGSWNIFLCSIFIILFFKLNGLKYKISKLAIKEM